MSPFIDDELRILVETATGVAHCPASNMKLSSGVARIPDMLELGVPVGLAVDGSASNDCSGVLQEMRIGYLLHRLTGAGRAPTGYDILKIATRGGAALLGRSDIGHIAEGMSADLFLVDESRLELAGACFDYKTVLAAVGISGAVYYTVVNGNVVVHGGRLEKAEAAQLCRDACCEAKKMRDK